MRLKSKLLCIAVCIALTSSLSGQFCVQDIPVPGFNPTDIALDSLGRLWVQDDEAKLLSYTGHSFTAAVLQSPSSLRGLNHQELNSVFSSSGHELFVQKDGIAISNPESQGQETIIKLKTDDILDLAIDPWGSAWILKDSRELIQIYPCPLIPLKHDTTQINPSLAKTTDLNEIRWSIQDSTLRSISPDGSIVIHRAIGTVADLSIDRYDRLWLLQNEKISLYQYDRSPGDLKEIKTWSVDHAARVVRYFDSAENGQVYYDSDKKQWHLISFESWLAAPVYHPPITQLWSSYLDKDQLHYVMDDGLWMKTNLARNETSEIRSDIQAPFRSMFIKQIDRVELLEDNTLYLEDGEARPFQFSLSDQKLMHSGNTEYIILDEKAYTYDSRTFQIKPPLILSESIKNGAANEFSDYSIVTYHPYAYRYIITEYRRNNESWQLAESNSIPAYFFTHGEQEIEIQSYVRGYKKESLARKTVTISRPTPLEKNPWFLLILTLLTVGLVIAFILFRERKMKNIESQQRKQYQEKIKVTQLERSALQLQMNPHFIFNTLNTIRAVMRRGDQNKADMLIQTFAGLMRSQLEMSRKPFTSIDDEVTLLQQYLQLEQAAHDTAFTFSIHADLEALYDVQLPTMLLQPIVENAVIHGIGGRTNNKGGIISVSFKEVDNDLHIFIKDNGPGFQNKPTTSAHQSVAMQVIQERITMIPGARLERINYNEAGLSGACVKLMIPIA